MALVSSGAFETPRGKSEIVNIDRWVVAQVAAMRATEEKTAVKAEAKANKDAEPKNAAEAARPSPSQLVPPIAKFGEAMALVKSGAFETEAKANKDAEPKNAAEAARPSPSQLVPPVAKMGEAMALVKSGAFETPRGKSEHAMHAMITARAAAQAAAQAA